MNPVVSALGLTPGKVIAVHLNYRSRATQRGRTPAHPSYFLKAPSSLSGSGELGRPDGTELLSFEGEIALVIGTTAHRVAPTDGWCHVGWVTAANDLGLYDFRYADRGSNLRAKSGDGFTPIGPGFLPADEIAPARLRVRTWVDGQPAQSADAGELLFGFGELVADLSRLSTLHPGDVILTGTPAGASIVKPGQRVEVEVDQPGQASTGRLATTITTGPAVPPHGAPPRVDETTRSEARGETATEPVGQDVLARLRHLGVATLSAQLRAQGMQQVHIDGVRPARAGRGFAGRARTLRYVPLREDLFAEHGDGFNAQKRAVESLGPGEVLVMDARGDTAAGTIGDILALRAQQRGAAAIVTDGCARDAAAIAGLDLPVYHAGAHPAVLGRRHVPWEVDTAIGCGGATVAPGDVVVGDDNGVLVIPPALAAEVAGDAEEQERRERFIAEQVRAGHGIAGLYPLTGEWLAAYQRWQQRHADGSEGGSR
ncbi:fumarylacetoacetate hydrolase family protein [Haloechinothrix sp. LS1_15]|uniref:fumarylacetoacetate hydrolase family protein n=1 Tax=Haloechinothrix sp. LS1_15 TaxID=2652248 RepID=UPI002945871F|nr:fumarylacetoacetate hydrolase family protein [Haloechinothrix sp. LS1_15]MDV6011881.1 fumarylacetoacetate hydrolase family protein [Haloechinothrix sp. LS1_15]